MHGRGRNPAVIYRAAGRPERQDGMRRCLLAAITLVSLMGAFAEAGGKAPRTKAHRNSVGQVYSPTYGYSVARGGSYGTNYGSSAPLGGNFQFAPGFGYGSIYGNNGNPGYNTYRGPSWGNPAAWGY
jgi:hypothetical protein